MEYPASLRNSSRDAEWGAYLYRILLPAALAIALAVSGLAGSTARAEDAGPGLQRVEVTAVRNLCRRLSRRGEGTVSADPNVADFRVTWAYGKAQPLLPALGRLAELTDSQLVTVGDPAAKRYALRRRAATVQLEREWRTSARREGLTNLFRPGDRRNAASRPDEAMLGYLGALSPLSLRQLADGEELQLSGNALPAPQRRRLLRAWFGTGLFAADPATPVGREVYAHLEQRLTAEGVSLMFDTGEGNNPDHLTMALGGDRINGCCFIGQIKDERRELPPSRSNPYRRLETLGTKPIDAPAPPLPDAARQPLACDLTFPPDGRWSTALRTLAETAGVDVISDDYLTRAESVVPGVKPGQIVASQGTPLADALDLLCDRFGYLWWQRAGCYYFRSRAWAHDAAADPPDLLVRRIDQGLRRRGAITASDFAALAGLTARQWEGLARVRAASPGSPGGPPKPEEKTRRLCKLVAALPLGQSGVLLRQGVVVTQGDPWGIVPVWEPPVPQQLHLSQQAREVAGPLGATWQIAFTLVARHPSGAIGHETFYLALPSLGSSSNEKRRATSRMLVAQK